MIDLEQHLIKSGKQALLKTAEASVNDSQLYKQLIDLALSEKQPASKKAVWTLDMVFDLDQHIIEPYLPDILKKLPEFKEERNQGSFLHLFSRMDFDLETDNLGILFDFCLYVLQAEKVQMYMKHYALLVLENMGKQIPELIPEICFEINENMERYDRDHLKNMGKRIIKDFEKLNPEL